MPLEGIHGALGRLMVIGVVLFWMIGDGCCATITAASWRIVARADNDLVRVLQDADGSAFVHSGCRIAEGC